MNVLDEIFKDNTALLDEPEVKKMIAYAKEQYEMVVKRMQALQKLEDYVVEQCVHSELMLKQGRNSKDTLKSILEYIDNME